MVTKISNAVKRLFSNRMAILVMLFAAMSLVLSARLVKLQLIDGQKYAENFSIKTTKTKTLKSSRGNIYDARGKLLAYNQLSNSVTIADNGTYETVRQKNLSLNAEIYRLIELIRSRGDTLYYDFRIEVSPDDTYVFDMDNEILIDRFRADVYGYRTIEELKPEERQATPEKIMHDLGCEKRFGLFHEATPYTEEELTAYGLPLEWSKEDFLAVTRIRYQLSLISFQRYMSVTIATDVSDETVAAVKENADVLPGVSIEEDYIRVYNSSLAMSPILGYTGRPSATELEALRAEDDRYSSLSVIGKAGIEQSMETVLQGVDGSEEVTVDNLGRVLSENEASRVDPVQGNDVYLTIDAELQDACYTILEQRIAGIILMYLVDAKTIDLSQIEDIVRLPIPSYDVYYALINNAVIDIDHFKAEDATAIEKEIQAKFETRQNDILGWIRSVFLTENAPAYNQFTTEQKVYFDYLFDQFLSLQHGVLDENKIETTDPVYQSYVTDENISPQEFLHYAVSNDWIDLTKLQGLDAAYLTTDEIYLAVLDYLDQNLRDDLSFRKLLYKYMLLNDFLSPEELCQVLYAQEILQYTSEDDLEFTSGRMSAFELIQRKIRSLELTPAMLALDPCSGSIVVTDPATGYVKACVTYPGYDNTRLANNMDVDYYNAVNTNLSTPFYNKATQQSVAPGSTFKPITAAAGLNEGIVDRYDQVICNGLFGPGLVPESDYVECWLKNGHGEENVVDALGDSCNVYFCTLGYRMGLDDRGRFTQSKSLLRMHRYAAQFGLNKKTGVQIPETEPQVSDSLPIPSAMGQGTHRYSTVQLARYVSTIANKGNCYELTLVEKINDSNGNLIQQFEPKEITNANLPDWVWNAIYDGMQKSVDDEQIWNNVVYDRIIVRGKTGTAEETKVRSDHALSIGFTKTNPNPSYVIEGLQNYHYEKHGEIAYAVRIGNGYTSRNTNLIAMDMLYYYYGIMDESQIMIGQADTSMMADLVQRDDTPIAEELLQEG